MLAKVKWISAITLPLFAGIVAIALSAPAYAIDCTRAKTVAEVLICSDPGLRSADARLNDAFASALKASDGRDIREAVIRDQKRWVEARDRFFENVDKNRSAATQKSDMSSLIGNRIHVLSISDPKFGGIDLPSRFKRQKAHLSKYSGGPYAGIVSRCDFFEIREEDPYSEGSADTEGHLPDDVRSVVYDCSGPETFQNGNRICRLDAQCREHFNCGNWGHDYRTVADVIGGVVRIKAVCMMGHGNCPELYDEPGDWQHWDWSPRAADKDYPVPQKLKAANASKLDIAGASKWDWPWIDACLSDPQFPKPH